MLACPALLLLLAASGPDTARAELEDCAERIEALKARGERGAELERLLRRAQDLAAGLERAGVPAPARPPDAPAPEELRERADAARDEADRLAAEIAALDVRIQDARRARGDVARAALGAAPPPPPAHRVRALLAERAALAERRARAEAEAARLEAEARDAEQVP